MEKKIRYFKFVCEKCNTENTLMLSENDGVHVEIHYAPCNKCNHTNHFSEMPTEKELEKTSSFSNSDKGD